MLREGGGKTDTSSPSKSIRLPSAATGTVTAGGDVPCAVVRDTRGRRPHLGSYHVADRVVVSFAATRTLRPPATGRCLAALPLGQF